MMDSRPTAYSYVRMSTQQQLKGDSLRRQLERSREYAERNGLRLDDSLHDIGVSAFTGANVKAGALGRFLEMVQQGQIKRGSYLLVESLDRLSRLQVRNALGPFIELINAGIIIVTLVDNQVYSDSSVDENWTQLMLSLAIMSRAHEESQTKSDRIKQAAEGRRKRASRGETRFSQHIFRWLDQIQVEPDKYEYRANEHAKTVLQIFEWADTGIGQVVMTRRLNEANVPTFTGKGQWQQPTIGLILKNQAVIGTYQPTHRVDGKTVPYGDPIPNYLPQIVPDDLFWRVQANKREPYSSGRKGKLLTNLLGPLAQCVSCWGRMGVRSGGAANKPQKYFRCDNNYRGGTCEANGQFRCDYVEEAILDNVRDFHRFTAFAREEQSADTTGIEQQLAQLETQLAQLSRQRTNLMGVAALADDDESRSDIMREISQRKTKETNVREEMEILRSSLAQERARASESESLEQRITNERKMWETGTPERVYDSRSRVSQALNQIIDFVVFDAANNRFRVVIGAGMLAYEFDKKGNRTNAFDLRRSTARFGLSPLTGGHFLRASGVQFPLKQNEQNPDDAARIDRLKRLLD